MRQTASISRSTTYISLKIGELDGDARQLSSSVPFGRRQLELVAVVQVRHPVAVRPVDGQHRQHAEVDGEEDDFEPSSSVALTPPWAYAPDASTLRESLRTSLAVPGPLKRRTIKIRPGPMSNDSLPDVCASIRPGSKRRAEIGCSPPMPNGAQLSAAGRACGGVAQRRGFADSRLVQGGEREDALRPASSKVSPRLRGDLRAAGWWRSCPGRVLTSSSHVVVRSSEADEVDARVAAAAQRAVGGQRQRLDVARCGSARAAAAGGSARRRLYLVVVVEGRAPCGESRSCPAPRRRGCRR